MTFKKDVRVVCKKCIFTARDGEKNIPFILITKTYKHYGEIYQSLHRFRLSPDIRAGGTQGVTNRFPEPIVLRREPDECENDFERWIYLLKHMDTLERMPFKAKKAVFDNKNTIDYAEEKGILKGKESTARNMKAEGIAPLIIQKCTGLSLEDIEKL